MYAPREKMLEYGKHLKNFVETGTYLGETSIWASQYWDVYTVELSPTLFKVHWGPRIHSYKGDSRDILKGKLYAMIQAEPCIFWLDGHWFDHGVGVAGDEKDCPLLEEVELITHTAPNHVIFIDDAHLIKSKQDHYQVWPTLEEILKVSDGYFYEYIENTLVLRREIPR